MHDDFLDSIDTLDLQLEHVVFPTLIIALDPRQDAHEMENEGIGAAWLAKLGELFVNGDVVTLVLTSTCCPGWLS